MTCQQANRVARAVVSRLGYEVVHAEAAEVGKKGVVVGRRARWAGAEATGEGEYSLTVNVTCTAEGAGFEGLARESVGRGLAFRRQFQEALAAAASTRVARPQSDTAPRRGLFVIVEPQRSSEALGEFGFDLPAHGVMPVRVRIENRTARAYVYQQAQLQLVAQDGRRVSSLPLGEAARAVSAEVRARMAERLLAEGEIAAGEIREGFAFFPAAAYRRAKLTLFDRESGEPEGLAIDF